VNQRTRSVVSFEDSGCDSGHAYSIQLSSHVLELGCTVLACKCGRASHYCGTGILEGFCQVNPVFHAKVYGERFKPAVVWIHTFWTSRPIEPSNGFQLFKVCITSAGELLSDHVKLYVSSGFLSVNHGPTFKIRSTGS
jgi:hypothetical protein